jgi:hypothetical protein
VILDRLADLNSLAERASSTAETLTEDAAFADVQNQIGVARSLFVNLGMARPRPLSLLEETERQAVIESTKRVKTALEAITDATDDELAAYAASTAEKRGSLLAVSRQAQALRTELLAAQRLVLERLAEQVWPAADLLRLDVIAHISDNAAAAAAARRAEDVHQRLMARAAEVDVGLSGDDLDELIDSAATAAAETQPLRERTVDDEVLEFWSAADSEEGAPLAMLTPGVQTWLEGYDALDSFRLYRTR